MYIFAIRTGSAKAKIAGCYFSGHNFTDIAYVACQSHSAFCLFLQGIKNISVQSSTTLQHLPYCVDLESDIPSEIQGKLSFACQKLKEIVKAKSASASSGSLTSALPQVSESLKPLSSSWWSHFKSNLVNLTKSLELRCNVEVFFHTCFIFLQIAFLSLAYLLLIFYFHEHCRKA